MSFFARPNLEDVTFKQIIGTQLTLSGETRIATTSGLTLIGDSGYIPIILTGATNYDILTYNDGKITLKPASGGMVGYYTGASPTTCSVGGLVAGTLIDNLNFSDILESILVPTLNPTLTPPSSTFTINPSISILEVGDTVEITGCTMFDRGCINPQYTSASDKLTGVASCYEYNVFGNVCCVPSLTLSCNSLPFDPYSINVGNNTLSSSVWYSSGVQPKNSAGDDYSSPYCAGYTNVNTIIVCGLYPYYYGRVTCAAPAGVGRPSASCIKSIITGGTGFCTKVVSSSVNTICANFGSTSNDYLWFAIPLSSPVKTKWCVDALNNGNIGGSVSAAGNLFPTQNNVTNVCSSQWNGQTYQIYVSNYQSSSSIMYFKNS